MLACTYTAPEKFALIDKPNPVLLHDRGAIVWIVPAPVPYISSMALYDGLQSLPLRDMYGKNLTFKTSGVDGCNCAEILELIAADKIETRPLISIAKE